MPEVEPTWMTRAERDELARIAVERAGQPAWAAGDKRMATEAEIEVHDTEG